MTPVKETHSQSWKPCDSRKKHSLAEMRLGITMAGKEQALGLHLCNVYCINLDEWLNSFWLQDAGLNSKYIWQQHFFLGWEDKAFPDLQR